MTHYSNDEGMVRIDRFKPSGKWYDTVAADMTGLYNWTDLSSAVFRAWQEAGGGDTTSRQLEEGWSIVCLEPYHRHACPIMIKG